MKTKVRYYEEAYSRVQEKKIEEFLRPAREEKSRMKPSTVPKNSFAPYYHSGTPQGKQPVRATMRSALYRQSSTNEDSREASIKTMRPPCRQSDNVFDLDNSSGPVKKTIKIVRKQPRPPARQKTPPKALGLDLPPNNYSIDLSSFESTPINQPLSMSQPINFALLEGKQQRQMTKPRTDSHKTRIFSQRQEVKPSHRVVSAHYEARPGVAVNKRKLETSHGISNEISVVSENPKRSISRVKQQNQPIFSNLQPEFLDLFG